MPYLITILILLIIIHLVLTVRQKRVVYLNKQQKQRQENKKKILEALRGTQGKITNNDVEKLLGVSDATATRYLDALEKEGKIEQIGKTGRSVYYQLKQ